MERLSVKGLALGLGVSWGICMFILGIFSIFGPGIIMVDLISSIYLGFRPTILGSIIGGGWGFIDGAIGGAIIAFIYNLVVRKV